MPQPAPQPSDAPASVIDLVGGPDGWRPVDSTGQRSTSVWHAIKHAPVTGFARLSDEVRNARWLGAQMPTAVVVDLITDADGGTSLVSCISHQQKAFFESKKLSHFSDKD